MTERSYEPDPMDYVRATIDNARAHGLNINDIARCAEHAHTPQEWDVSVNLLCHMTPDQTP